MSTISQILQNFRAPVPKNLISNRPQGGVRLSYITWVNYCQLLDQRAGLGSWQWEIKNVYTTEAHLFLVGKLSLIGSDKTIVFESTGEEKLKCSSFGDPSSNAEAMALRRACCKAGLSRELWMK